MPERISDELLATAPITNDEHARALKELIHERVMANRRKDADARQDAALAKLAAIEAEAASEKALEEAIAKSDAADAVLEARSKPAAVVAKPKKEKK